MEKITKKYQENTYVLTEDEVRVALINYMNDQHSVVVGDCAKKLNIFISDDCKLIFKNDPFQHLLIIDKCEVT